MTAKDFKEIELSKLDPNPWNPRSDEDFRGQKFDELVASIRAKGVYSPILVRPKKKDRYEIIFGERRFRASCVVAQENGGIKKAKIPALVRELSDDDAFDACLIENLQREDLTELQEANMFKAWVERRAKKDRKADVVKDLSDRTGKGARYIRRRLAVLALPAEVLKAWDKGLITIGHCEQLTRLTEKKQILMFLSNCTERWDPMTVSDLRDAIDEEAVAMKKPWFDVATAGCNTCQKNTDVQRELLFGDEMEQEKHGSCLDPQCYEKYQREALTAGWEEKYRKKWGTNGFRFERDFNGRSSDWGKFNGKRGADHKDIADKCLSCEHFVTVLEASGNPAWEQACADIACYQKLKKPVQPSRQQRSSSPDRVAPDSSGDSFPQAPLTEAPGRVENPAPRADGFRLRIRASWHGRHFREEFFKEILPSWISNLEPDSDRCLRIVLAGILNSNFSALEYFRKMEMTSARPSRYGRYHFEAADWKFIEGMDCVALRTSLKALGGYIAMQTDKTSHETRCAIAAHLGIDLARDWRITQSYLDKKTKAEILAFGEALGIFADTKAQAFLKDTLGKRKFSSLKKTELDRVILESGVDLSGKVPPEILDLGDPRDSEEDEGGCMDYVSCTHFDECEHIASKCKRQWQEGEEWEADGKPPCCYECDHVEGCEERCRLYHDDQEGEP